MPNLLLFFSFFSVNFCLCWLSDSVSLRLSSWANPICVNTNATLKHAMPSYPERCLFTLAPKIFTGKLWASPWSDRFAFFNLLFYITYWLVCRHDNNMSLWQQTSHEVDFRTFGHIMLLEAFPRLPRQQDGRTQLIFPFFWVGGGSNLLPCFSLTLPSKPKYQIGIKEAFHYLAHSILLNNNFKIEPDIKHLHNYHPVVDLSSNLWISLPLQNTSYPNTASEIVQRQKPLHNQLMHSVITEEIPQASHKRLSRCVWPQTIRQHKYISPLCPCSLSRWLVLCLPLLRQVPGYWLELYWSEQV